MKKRIIAVFVICSILLIGLASAGAFESFKRVITGKATSQPTNVSVNVVGATQVTVGPVDNSTLTGGVTPTESGSTSTTIYATVCDADGVNDINNSATDVTYHAPTSGTREGSCSYTNDIDSNCANFTCTVDMWYFDESGIWTINVTGNDLGNGTANYNDTYTFQFNQLKALVIAPEELNWSSLSPGDTSVGADNDPTTVNNTGNYDGTIDVTGYDLYGTTTSEMFGVTNFTADETDGACGAGTQLVNNSAQTLPATDSNPGNLSAGGGAGQEEIFYCIPTVPSVSTQEYTTDQNGAWIVAY